MRCTLMAQEISTIPPATMLVDGNQSKHERKIGKFRFVTHVTFFGHLRCPQERLEGVTETDATAETRQ
jgi:hypothetical protein